MMLFWSFLYIIVFLNLFHRFAGWNYAFEIFWEVWKSSKIWGHAAKNLVGQLVSCTRTVYMGRFWVDLAGAMLHGLPGSAYVRKDSQSDALSALCMNPTFYRACAAPNSDWAMVRVSWESRGALLFSLTCGLCFAPSLHQKLTLEERAESVVCGFVLLDLWQLMSAKKESNDGCRVGSYSLSSTPVAHLQNVCLGMLTFLLSKPAACILHYRVVSNDSIDN